MKTIRYNTFETNSSSTHSITVYDNTLTTCDLPVQDFYSEIDDMYMFDALMVELTGFCGYNDHESQNDRLALCCLLVIYDIIDEPPHCMTDSEYKNAINKVYNDERWKALEDDIKEYVNCDIIRIKEFSEGYIDHDSLDYYEKGNRLKDFLSHHGFGSVYSYVFAKDVITHFEFCG